MALATDRQLAGFFEFLGHQIGLANIWIALSADHGIAPLPKVATGSAFRRSIFPLDKIRAQVNSGLSTRLSHPAEYVKQFDYPVAWLNSEAFAAVKVNEQDAERDVGEALKAGWPALLLHAFQLERGDAPNTELGVEVSAQLFAARGMVYARRSAALRYRLRRAERTTQPLTTTTLMCRWLSMDFRSKRELIALTPSPSIWPRPRFAAGDQCANPLHRTGPDRNAGSAAPRRESLERRAGSQLARGRRPELQARCHGSSRGPQH